MGAGPVLERAQLAIVPGREAEFEAAFAQAEAVIGRPFYAEKATVRHYTAVPPSPTV